MPGLTGVTLLSDAFAEFISASSRLEVAYEKLQLDVTHLSCELADRNSALKLSLAENERVHRALQQIVDSMPCGVLVVEDDGSVLMINPEGRRLLDLGGSPADNLVQISLDTGLDLAGFLKRRTAVDLGPDQDQEQEFCKASCAGRRWLAVHDRRLFAGDQLELNGRRQTILILRDITSHRQAEQERERARRATALSEVATTLAHEIRNPLASLELFAGLIARGGQGATEWVSHLHAGIRSLSGTVNNVLSFHSSGFLPLIPIDLAASLRSSLEFVRPIADQAGIELQFHDDELHPMVLGNDGALQQIVLNMVCNAIRHTKAGGTVSVVLREGETQQEYGSGSVVIEFSDTGCGISPEDLKQIFNAGFSASGNTSGLGLAVCTRIIDQHEGEIRVSSTPGVGTTFYVEIPVL